ncbi:MAG: adenylyltransferase/cytidyltransferase family protein [Verrucomicrobiota bacterium]|nr:adenylyltransferase/cytidyltransferase family protein [Verrucomicrobiota bacterium]
MELINPKLFNLEEAVRQRSALRKRGAKLVLTNGCFDLLHPGHLFFLQGARQLGDALFVAVNGDASVKALKGPTRPILGEYERAYALAALSCVDGLVIFQSPRLDAEITALTPDIYSKAGDYSLDRLNPLERAALEKVGASIQFLPFLPGFSTTSLINKITHAGGFS